VEQIKRNAIKWNYFIYSYCLLILYLEKEEWVRPIDKEITTKIKLKKKSWKKFIKTMDIVDYNNYKDIRNEVRHHTRQYIKMKKIILDRANVLSNYFSSVFNIYWLVWGSASLLCQMLYFYGQHFNRYWWC